VTGGGERHEERGGDGRAASTLFLSSFSLSSRGVFISICLSCAIIPDANPARFLRSVLGNEILIRL
jgi:hypothetical protein